jgi:N-methyltransferase StaMA
VTRWQVPASAAVGEMYNQLTDSCASALGGNLHVGYWSDDHDETPVGEATDRLTDLVAERLALKAGQRVLDVGSGTGRPAERVAAAYEVHVTGITLSPYQVEISRDRRTVGEAAGSTDFQLANAMRLPFGDACFDAAYAIESLVHMEDPALAFREIARVLRPGARLAVGEWYLRDPLASEDADDVEHLLRRFHVHMLTTAEEIREQLDKSGLEVGDFQDIWSNVSRSFRLVSEVLPSSAAERGEEVGDELAACAELYAHLGEIPQVSYALFTATRR